MSSFLEQIQNHWVIIVSLLGAVFFLYRIREEIRLKVRLDLICECYSNFAELNDAIQNWAHPLLETQEGESGDDAIKRKMESFHQDLEELYPKARRSFHEASLLIRPETVRELNNIFVSFGLMRAEYRNWHMYKSSGNAFPKELQTSFDNFRKNLPNKIEKALNNLLTDFQIMIHGVFRMLIWKNTSCLHSKIRGLVNHDLPAQFEEDRKKALKELK